jgi:hypothetical protein
MWGEVYTVVGVVGGQDCEIEHGGQFWRAKLKTDTCELAFGVERANDEGGCGGGLWGGGGRWWAHAIARRLDPVDIGI